MNMFTFFPRSNVPAVSKDFWLYWAITIPLTLVVLATWALWMHLRHRGGRGQNGNIDNSELGLTPPSDTSRPGLDDSPFLPKPY